MRSRASGPPTERPHCRNPRSALDASLQFVGSPGLTPRHLALQVPRCPPADPAVSLTLGSCRTGKGASSNAKGTPPGQADPYDDLMLSLLWQWSPTLPLRRSGRSVHGFRGGRGDHGRGSLAAVDDCEIIAGVRTRLEPDETLPPVPQLRPHSGPRGRARALVTYAAPWARSTVLAVVRVESRDSARFVASSCFRDKPIKLELGPFFPRRQKTRQYSQRRPLKNPRGGRRLRAAAHQAEQNAGDNQRSHGQ